MEQKASKQSTPSRYLAWPAAIAVLLALAGFAWYLLAPARSPSVGTLEEWVRGQQFAPIRPMRSGFIPGTLMHVSTGDRDRMAMAADDFLGPLKDKLVISKLPDTTINVTFNAGGEVRLGPDNGSRSEVASVIGKVGTDLRAELMLTDIETLTLTLDKVNDIVSSNTRIQEALRSTPDNLFVVLESLRVGKLAFKFEDKADASLVAALSEKLLQPSFSGNLRVGADGVVRASTPMVVGASLAKLQSVSKVLGGGEQVIELKPMTAEELLTFRQSAAAKTTRLYSGYDVHALVMGLGNYPIGTPRAGGQLPDAIRTAEFVATTLRQTLPPAQAGQVRVITSEESSTGIYDPTKRLSRHAMLAAVDEFVVDIKKSSDQTKQTLVLFYYFGHGLAEGISKSVLLVPETFVDDQSKTVAELGSRLVDVNEVAKKLSYVTDKLVLLVDACRAHKDEAGQLEKTWREGLGQQADLSGVLGALQFASGIYGPHAMIFASGDGVAAPTIPLAKQGMHSGTGPLAIALSTLFDQLAHEGGSMDLRAFLTRLSTPITTNSDRTSVRGYSFMRQDFVEKFGPTPLLSSDPLPMAKRQASFRPPFDSLYSKLGGENQPPPGPKSGTSLTVVSELPESKIRGIAVSSDGRKTWILDWSERVLAVGHDGTLRIINEGLPSHTIAWDHRHGLVLSQWDSQVLYALGSGEWKVIATGVRPDRLSTDGAQEILVHERGEGPRHILLKLASGKLHHVIAFDSESLLDFARTADGRTWKVEPESITRVGGPALANAGAMWRPTFATATGLWLYLLSQEGRMLYRVSAHGKVEWLDLFDISLGDGYVIPFGGGGFCITATGVAFIATGTRLLKVDLERARWQQVSSRIRLAEFESSHYN